MSATQLALLFLTTSLLLVRGHTVLKNPNGRQHALRRVRRDGVDKKGFTTDEKQKILDLHNKFRGQETASDMTLMEWDSGLEEMAQSWADQCIWTHSSNRFSSDYSYIGENLYANTAIPSALEIVKDWNDEKSHYNYYTQQCSKVCGHYTQIVWARSHALGCGIRFCRNIQNLNWDQYGGGYVVVCNYGPGGNIIGETPYTRSKPACSACPKTHPYCIQRLCSKTKQIVSLSTSNTVHFASVSCLLAAMVACWLS